MRGLISANMLTSELLDLSSSVERHEKEGRGSERKVLSCVNITRQSAVLGLQAKQNAMGTADK